MLIPILAIVVLLVGWSLHLMQAAVDRREFSLMLAGTLVAFSAAALMTVYCLMGNYVGYVTNAARDVPADPLTATSLDWLVDYNNGEDRRQEYRPAPLESQMGSFGPFSLSSSTQFT